MHRLNGKRVMRIMHNMLSTNDIPKSVGIFLENMCKEYGFDRVRSYIKLKGTEEYKHLHDVKAGGSWEIFEKIDSIDMTQTHYPKSGDTLGYMGQKIFEEKLIHTTDFQKIQKEMCLVGYIPDNEKPVQEAIISCVRSFDESFGSFGYLIFEKYESVEPISELDIKEIKDLCKVCNDRIVSFETGKQLKTEETMRWVDELTGLPVLEDYIKKTNILLKKKLPIGILYLDIDKFKYINEIWGYEIGNEILNRTGEVLLSFTGPREPLCRISGDKFGVTILIKDVEELRRRLDDLNEAFSKMQELAFPQIKITIITGVYIAFEDISTDIALDKANLARVAVKGSYKNIYHCYNDVLGNQNIREKELENKMIFALNNGEFQPYFQPKFDLTTGKFVGAEALVRWMSEDGMIAPDEFIPIFEKNGFITKMDFAIYEQVFGFIKSQLSCGCKILPISVNVSREHLDNEDFVKEFCELMQYYEVSPEMIEIEITENIFVKDKDKLKVFIENIRNKGIVVSIDDFGIAYSSLNLLNDIQVDVIKIDKSFISNLSIDNSENSKDKIIIKNVLNMIHELGIKSLFEGVEKAEHTRFLKEVGCVYGQGYYYEKPLPLHEFREKYCTF